MTAANPPELTPTKNVHNQSMSIFMKESDIMTAANPLNSDLQIYGHGGIMIIFMKKRHNDSCKPP